MKTIISRFKKYTAMAMMGLAAVVYSGCTDLDESPYTFIDPDSFYTSETDIDAALNNTYRAFRDMATSRRNYVAALEILTDQGEANYRKESQNQYRNTWSDMNNINNTFSDVWSKSFETINDANIVLGRVDGIDMDETAKNYVKGQARFLRAYSFYHIVRIYGGCPIPLTYTSGISGLKVPRATADEVWAQIFEDLKTAADLLPVRGTSGYADWRATKASCNALLGEAYLYKATISNENNLSANQDELQQSKNYSELVINEATQRGNYELLDDYTDLWYWFNQNAKNNAESIFELQFFNGDGGTNDMAIDFGVYSGMKKDGNIVAGAYYCRYGPTLDLYLSYDANDERRQVFLTEFTNKQDVHYTYSTEKEYWISDTGNPLLIESDRFAFHTLLNAKYFDPWADASLYNSMPAPNFPMLRYAEVLLNYAEAANLLSAGDGIDELNQVRTRAGLSAYSFVSQEDMDNTILQERLWEFPGECKAYYDELRKGVLGDRAEETAWRSYQIYLKNELLGTGSESRLKYFFPYPMTNKPTKSWLWKIPSSDLSSNTLLEQNPDNTSASLNYSW